MDFNLSKRIQEIWFPVNDPGLSKLNTVIEIGALSGNISIYTVEYLNAKQVYAIEASPNNFNILKNNVKAYNEIIPLQIAINSKDEDVIFYEDDESINSSSIFNINTKYSRFIEQKDLKKTYVKGLTLTTLLKKLNMKKVDLIISNCEGAEVYFYREIGDLNIKFLTIEFHPQILGHYKSAYIFFIISKYMKPLKIRFSRRGPYVVFYKRREKRKTNFLYYFTLLYGLILDFSWPIISFLYYKILKKLW